MPRVCRHRPNGRPQRRRVCAQFGSLQGAAPGTERTGSWWARPSGDRIATAVLLPDAVGEPLWQRDHTLGRREAGPDAGHNPPSGPNTHASRNTHTSRASRLRRAVRLGRDRRFIRGMPLEMGQITYGTAISGWTAQARPWPGPSQGLATFERAPDLEVILQQPAEPPKLFAMSVKRARSDGGPLVRHTPGSRGLIGCYVFP